MIFLSIIQPNIRCLYEAHVVLCTERQTKTCTTFIVFIREIVQDRHPVVRWRMTEEWRKIIKITYIHYLIFLNGVLSEEVQPANML